MLCAVSVRDKGASVFSVFSCVMYISGVVINITCMFLVIGINVITLAARSTSSKKVKSEFIVNSNNVEVEVMVA